jgi:hypothetical protein
MAEFVDGQSAMALTTSRARLRISEQPDGGFLIEAEAFTDGDGLLGEPEVAKLGASSAFRILVPVHDRVAEAVRG